MENKYQVLVNAVEQYIIIAETKGENVGDKKWTEYFLDVFKDALEECK